MTQYLIAAPVKDLFTLPDQFKAIFNGKIYIGAVDTDPLNPTNQISIYVVNEDDSRTQVAQPIPINSGGYATYNGSPAKFVCDEPYSIIVLDRNDAEQWRAPDIRAIDLMNVTHNDLPERNAVGAHDQIYRRNTDASEVESGAFAVGDLLDVSDKQGKPYKVVSGGTPDGDKIIDAGNGNTAQLDTFNNSLRTLKSSPNEFQSVTLTATGQVNIGKAGTTELPYYYDENGVEYVDSTAIQASIYPPINRGECPSFCVTSGANLILVGTPSESDAGYLLYSLVNNLTTTNDSLATTGNDITAFRLNRVQHAVWMCVGLNKFDASTGTWTDVNMNQVDPSMPAFNASRRYVYKSNNSNSNQSITYNSIPVIDGIVRMTFISTASSNPGATITIDGTPYIVDLTQSVGEFLTFNFVVTSKKNVQVVIENTSLGTNYFCNFAGFYFSELKDYKGTPVDEYGYYRDTATWSEYSPTVNNSDNDYVLREYTSDTYGCGYHGGESGIINKFFDGDTEFTPAALPTASLSLRYETQATVDWTPAGSPVSITLYKRTRFVKSGISRECWFEGDITLNQEYSTLMGVNNSFTKLLSPATYDILTDVADGQRLKLGKHSRIVYKNPATEQEFHAELTMHRYDNGNQYDGVYVWRVDGSYNKLYYNQVHGGRLRLSKGTYVVNNFYYL